MLVITATDLSRFMACPGSRVMPESFPQSEINDVVRNEGNAAHWVVQTVHSGQQTAEELVDRKSPEGVYITPEMIEHLEQYLVAVMTPGALVETNTSYSGQNWQVSGRADLVLYDPDRKHLLIGDLKYGWSIVEPFMNWTLISHIFGFMINNPDKPILTATVSVYQPRPYHAAGRVRSWSLTNQTIAELFTQLNNALSNPSNQLFTSPHCRNCPALATCPTARAAAMNVVEMAGQAFADDIDNDALAFQLDQLERAAAHLKNLDKATRELATYRLKQGQIVQNYGLETELTNRAWRDEITPEFMQMMTGLDLTKKQLITPAQAEKAGVPKEVVASFTERHNKGVKLVRIDADAKARKHLATN